MLLAELIAAGSQPVTGKYAFSLTTAAGAHTAINLTTPVPTGEATVEELVVELLKSLTRQNRANILALAGKADADFVSLNGTQQGANFVPTAYAIDDFTPDIDLTADIGNVTPTYSEDSGGTSAVAVTLTVDRDGVVVESVPKVAIIPA